MTLHKKVLIAFCAFACSMMPVNLFATELTDEQIGNISSKCASIKMQLQNVQKYDAKSRVHLGAQFEAISSSLMMNLNLRLVKNNRANGNISSQQTEFSNVRDRFKREYIAYQRELDALISINCKDEPVRFYEKLETVRERRAEITEDINRLKEIAAEHRQSVLDMRDELYQREHPEDE